MWIEVKSSGTMVAEQSCLTRKDGAYECPCCGKPIYRHHVTCQDKQNGEVMGTRFRHPCGTKLLIIND